MKFYSILIFFVSAVILSSCKPRNNQPAKTPSEVFVSKTEYTEIRKCSEYIGQVDALPYPIVTRVEGVITKVNFEFGRPVEKGQILFELEKASYKAEVLKSEGILKITEGNLNYAILDYKRLKKLSETGASAKKDFQLAEVEKIKCEGRYSVAKGNLDLAEIDLSYTTICSPCKGRIGFCYYPAGVLVNPATGALAHVFQTDSIYVKIRIPEVDLLDIVREQYNTLPKNNQKLLLEKFKRKFVPGLTVKLKLPNGVDYSEIGKIYFVDNSIDQSTGSIELAALFENPENILITGMYVTVTLEFMTKLKRILIPQASLMEDQVGSYVYTVDKNNTVLRKNIKIGNFYDKSIAVLSGLKEGESVIVGGLQKVRPGYKVTIKYD